MIRTLAALLALCGLGTAASVATGQTAPAAAPPTAAPARYTAADFAQLPLMESPDLSPDGKSYAARVASGGKQYFAIMSLEGGKPRLLQMGDVDLNWWRWVNDKWLLLGVGQLMNVEGTEMYVSRAVAMTADGTKRQVLARDAAQNADDVVWVASDGSARVSLAYQTSLYLDYPGFYPQVTEFDLETGKSRPVQRSHAGVWNWYSDGAGVVRMGIGVGAEGRTRRLLYRSRAGEQLRVVDRARTHHDALMAPSLFLPDGKSAIMVADDDAGLSAVYDLDLGTLARGKQLFASRGFDVAGLVTDETGSKLLGVRLHEDRSSVHWLDAEMAAIEKIAAAQVKNARVRLLSYSRDRQRALLATESPDSPGVYFLLDRASGQTSPIGYGHDVFRTKRLHPVRTIRYKARDGLEIAAVLTLPRGKKTGLPLVVMPHGGPFARDSEQWDWWTQFLADRGYAVVQPNYRGSSGYGTPFTRRGEGQWGLAMQDDLNDAVTALAAQGIADPKRVCMVGASYGGYAAMRAAQRDGKLYRCAVSYAGVSDLPGMRRYDSRFLMSGARSDWLKRQAPDLSAVSPVNAADAFSIPVLLVHGAKDRVVPLRQSKLMAQRLRAASKDVTYIEQREADHHFSRAEDRLEFLTALEAFLAKHNPT